MGRKSAFFILLLTLLAGCASPAIMTGRTNETFKGKISLSYADSFGPSLTGYGFMVSVKNIKAGNGRLYIADQGANRVLMVNFNGGFQDALGGPGTFTGIFDGPVSAAVDPAGNIFVLEQDSCLVRKINRLKDTVSSFGSRGRDEKSLYMPSDIAVNSYGDIYVCDTGNDAVKRTDVFGNFVSSFGHFGYGKGFFSGPSQIAADGSNNVFVLDAGNKRIQKFSPANDFMFEISKAGDGSGIDPSAMALDDHDVLFVADEKTGKVHFYSSDGAYIGNSALGPASGTVSSMAIAGGKYLFVSCDAGPKIHKFNIRYE